MKEEEEALAVEVEWWWRMWNVRSDSRVIDSVEGTVKNTEAGFRRYASVAAFIVRVGVGGFRRPM